MKAKSFIITLGAGMAAGAVVAMMLPQQNCVRKAAQQAADKVEQAVSSVTDCTCN